MRTVQRILLPILIVEDEAELVRHILFQDHLFTMQAAAVLVELAVKDLAAKVAAVTAVHQT